MLLQVLVEFTIGAACLLDLLQVLLEQTGREVGDQGTRSQWDHLISYSLVFHRQHFDHGE